MTGFTFLVLAHSGSLGKMAIKHVCVCGVHKNGEWQSWKKLQVQVFQYS